MYILDNRTTIVPEILIAESSVRTFLLQEIHKIIDQGLLDEVLMAHIHPLMMEERLPLVKEKIEKIVEKEL